MKMGNLNRTSMCNRYTHLHCMHWNRHEHAHTTRTIAIRILAPSDPFSGVSSVVFCVPYSLTLDIPHWLHLDSHHCELLLILCSSHGRIKCLVCISDWNSIATSCTYFIYFNHSASNWHDQEMCSSFYTLRLLCFSLCPPCKCYGHNQHLENFQLSCPPTHAHMAHAKNETKLTLRFWEQRLFSCPRVLK